MKTSLTKELEDNLYSLYHEKRGWGCHEVSLFGTNEIVDFISVDYDGIVKCYEIKVSKNDFYSNASKTFIGHYNYFVMPNELYELVMHDIPSCVGVYNGHEFIKKARKSEPKLSMDIIQRSIIRSMNREVLKGYLVLKDITL